MVKYDIQISKVRDNYIAHLCKPNEDTKLLPFMNKHLDELMRILFKFYLFK